MKRVLVLFNKLSDSPLPDELDVLEQVRLVEESVSRLGLTSSRAFMGMNLDETVREVRNAKPDIVFNLVESIGGKAELLPFAPALLQSLGIPYTGCPAESLMITSNKPMAKRMMAASGIRTPGWLGPGEAAKMDRERKYIIKPLWEDASVGIDDSSVIDGSETEISPDFVKRFGEQYFIEEYIEGREFNIAVLGSSKGPIVLPQAEIIFRNFPEGKPRIVGYDAKWAENSFEFENTPRTFDFPESDRELLDELERIALECWELFSLRGYARVDFRVGTDGTPYVLEVNGNPCISPDSGFYAATRQAGLKFEKVVEMIMSDI